MKSNPTDRTSHKTQLTVFIQSVASFSKRGQ